ncbi:MAG: hypothetical protein HZB19_09675 [Chloroflexi bacterium]|nr:hypothetical protein [Chloroflexota bacterium]
MNLKELILKIRNRFSPHEELRDEAVLGFLRVLEKVREEEAPCSEIFARLDEYVENELHGQDTARLMPLVKEHLDMCSDCCEEYEALLEVLEKTDEK